MANDLGEKTEAFRGTKVTITQHGRIGDDSWEYRVNMEAIPFPPTRILTAIKAPDAHYVLFDQHLDSSKRLPKNVIGAAHGPEEAHYRLYDVAKRFAEQGVRDFGMVLDDQVDPSTLPSPAVESYRSRDLPHSAEEPTRT